MANATKEKIEYIAISTLVLVALFIGITKFRKEGKEDEVFSRKQFKEKWEEVEILEANIPVIEKGMGYNIKKKRVPFMGPFDRKEKPKVVEKEDIKLPEMKFQGMVWNTQRPQAIINNKVYDVNSVIEVPSGSIEEEILIKDISREGILLKYRGKSFLVRPK